MQLCTDDHKGGAGVWTEWPHLASSVPGALPSRAAFLCSSDVFAGLLGGTLLTLMLSAPLWPLPGDHPERGADLPAPAEPRVASQAQLRSEHSLHIHSRACS